MKILVLTVLTNFSFDEGGSGVATTGGNGGSLSNGGIIFDNNNNFDNGGFDNTNLDPDINCDRLGTCYDGNFLVCI